MRRSCVVILLGFAVGANSGAVADEPLRVNSGLAAEIGVLRFSVIGGRLAAATQELSRSSNSSARLGDRQESLAINVEEGVPSLNYSLAEPHVQVQLDVARGAQFTLSAKHSGPRATEDIVLEQGATGGLSLTSGAGAGTRQLRFASVWAMWLAEPELCRRHVQPLLEMLRPEWRLAETAIQIQDALFRYADAPRDDPRGRWSELVGQLADERFVVRQKADHALREFGTAIVPFLERLPARQLDAEQRSRIRRIVADLAAAASEDQPDTVIPWLAGDPVVWAALLDGPDLARRRLAKEQLQRIVGEEVAYDPEATAAVRAEQVARIKAALEPGGNP